MLHAAAVSVSDHHHQQVLDVPHCPHPADAKPCWSVPSWPLQAVVRRHPPPEGHEVSLHPLHHADDVLLPLDVHDGGAQGAGEGGGPKEQQRQTTVWSDKQVQPWLAIVLYSL